MRFAPFLLAFIALVPSAPVGRVLAALVPIDEGPRQPDFVAFRQALTRAIADRDAPALLGVVHPDIRNSFGGDDGVEAFKRIWGPEQRSSSVWQELSDVLRLGGTFDGPDTFVAPYVFSRWPSEFDPFEHVALVGSRVRVRSDPNADAHVLATLDYAILQLSADKGYPQRPWTSVRLDDGRSGFVAANLVRSPIDYRAYFVRSNGRWQMTIFIAGD